MDEASRTGNIGRMMDLVDEHGNTIDKMFYAIFDGDLERIEYLEQFGINITDEMFVKAAVRNDQLLVIAYQVAKGTDVDKLIEIAETEKNQLIWNWAKCWKSVDARNADRRHSSG